jgi:hypothetical protein
MLDLLKQKKNKLHYGLEAGDNLVGSMWTSKSRAKSSLTSQPTDAARMVARAED